MANKHLVIEHPEAGRPEPASLIRKTPGVSGGEACIRATRIPVWILVRYRQQAVPENDILAAFPTLTVPDLEAAWRYYDEHRNEIDALIALDDREP